ncbi:uncharacterized protein METZ01_LOCUS148615, partial [marine metagenome]
MNGREKISLVKFACIQTNRLWDRHGKL